jgi:hypothetical protein
VRRRRRRTHSHGEFEAQATGRSLSIHTFARPAQINARGRQNLLRAPHILLPLSGAMEFSIPRAEPDK